MTKLLYLNNRELATTANVIATGTDSKGTFVQLDRTIFHPAGGGQKSDIGFIDNLQVHDVKRDRDSGLVHHYVNYKDENQVSKDNVALVVDRENRELQSKLHSAGHLIASVVEHHNASLVGSGGHHWPGEARVEFNTPNAPDLLAEDVQQLVDKAVADMLPVSCFEISSVRHIQFGEHKAVPCGGTHVSNSGELSGLNIKSVKFKKNKFRISYGLGD